MIDPTGKAGASAPPRVNPATLKAAPAVPAAAVAGQGDGQRTGAAAERVQSTISAIVEQGPPVDSAKVAAIKAGIADGSYTLDADRLARDILAQGAAGQGSDQ